MDREQEGIYLLLQYITRTPRLKIWEHSPCIFIKKGVLQGGITSPYLFLLVADRLTQAMEECGKNSLNVPVTSTWADDITVLTDNELDAYKVIYK